MKTFVELPKLSRGDKVAVLSPSAGLPGIFPWVFELGLDRLQDIFGLVSVEYPTTRIMNAPLKDRARDVMDAFADPSIKAVFTSIGGSDQIKLIKYLDKEVFINNPKPFFGFSDNTHLHNYLWSLGIPSYYGGGIMTQFAMQGGMTDSTTNSLHRALFEKGEFELEVSHMYNDEGLSWADQSNLSKERKWEANSGLVWDGEKNVEGVLWGGCVESLIVQSSTGKYLPSDADMEGKILVIETSEGIPEHWIITYLLTGFGERGWLEKFQAVLVGRPKAWEFNKQNSTEEKEAYRQAQQDAVVRIIREYNETLPIIQNVDFGHTDPQIILPLGNRARIDAVNKKIYLTY